MIAHSPGQPDTVDVRRNPYLVDSLPPIRLIATCAICGVTRELSHESIADGTWIVCPTCAKANERDVMLKTAA